MMDLSRLKDPFPKEAVSWRAQSVTRDGTRAMALAYIDARDVMDRLDDICGPENWQDRYIAHGERMCCEIGIRIVREFTISEPDGVPIMDAEWIWKADGAGSTDFEGDKGIYSDSFKRAAVRWGIGRYLYSLPAVWCPCESYEKNGKMHWKRWTDDPWNHVPRPREPAKQSMAQRREQQAKANGNTTQPVGDWQLNWPDGLVREFKMTAKGAYDALTTIRGALGTNASFLDHGKNRTVYDEIRSRAPEEWQGIIAEIDDLASNPVYADAG